MSVILNAAAFPSTLRLTSGEPVVLEAAEGEAGASGPAKFSANAYTGGAMSVEGFGLPVVVDLAGLSVPREKSPVLREHDRGRPIGHSAKIDVGVKGIKVNGLFSYPGKDADEVKASAANGYEWQTSIGTTVDQIEHVDRGQSVKVNGRNHPGPLYVIRKSRWRELSFVTLGADSNTSAKIAASSYEGDAMTFSEWLKAKKIDEAATPAETLEVLRATYKAEQTPPPPNPNPTTKGGNGDDESDPIKVARVEKARRDEINSLITAAVKRNPDNLDELEAISKQAVEQNWTIEKTESRLLIASVPTAAPLVFSRTRGDVTAKVLEASISRSIGLKDVEKHYDEQVLEAADHNFGGGNVGLLELIGLCARAGGFNDTVRSANLDRALKACRRAELLASAGPSTYNLGSILSDSANKIVREQFLFVEQLWKKLCATRPVKDFRQVESWSLTGDLVYQRIAKGGEIKTGTFADTGYTNKAEPYGLGLFMDRQHIVNDDAGILLSIYKRLGRGGGLILSKIFWTVVMGGQTAGFFSAAHADGPAGTTGVNYDDGVDTALTLDGLVAADLIWSAITDPDGQPMDHRAAFLVVPPAGRIPAKRLMTSEELGASDEEGTSNPLAGEWEVICSKYLNNPNYTGNSSKAYYLFADPNEVAAVEGCFLDGKEEPVVETVEPPPDRVGLLVRATHDFGFSLQEWRGAAKFKGEA